MQHFHGSSLFLLLPGEADSLSLDFSQPRPAETAPGIPILTSLSVPSSWPSCQFILPLG